jgi:hypothetical protein
MYALGFSMGAVRREPGRDARVPGGALVGPVDGGVHRVGAPVAAGRSRASATP